MTEIDQVSENSPKMENQPIASDENTEFKIETRQSDLELLIPGIEIEKTPLILANREECDKTDEKIETSCVQSATESEEICDSDSVVEEQTAVDREVKQESPEDGLDTNESYENSAAEEIGVKSIETETERVTTYDCINEEKESGSELEDREKMTPASSNEPSGKDSDSPTISDAQKNEPDYSNQRSYNPDLNNTTQVISPELEMQISKLPTSQEIEQRSIAVKRIQDNQQYSHKKLNYQKREESVYYHNTLQRQPNYNNPSNPQYHGNFNHNGSIYPHQHMQYNLPPIGRNYDIQECISYLEKKYQNQYDVQPPLIMDRGSFSKSYSRPPPLYRNTAYPNEERVMNAPIPPLHFPPTGPMPPNAPMWSNNPIHPQQDMALAPPQQMQIPPCAPNGSGRIINGPVPPPPIAPMGPMPPNAPIPPWGNNPTQAHTITPCYDQQSLSVPPYQSSQIPPCAPKGSAYPIPPPPLPPMGPMPPNGPIPPWGNNPMHPNNAPQICDQQIMTIGPPQQLQTPPCALNDSAYRIEKRIINGLIPPPPYPPIGHMPPNAVIPPWGNNHAHTIPQFSDQREMELVPHQLQIPPSAPNSSAYTIPPPPYPPIGSMPPNAPPTPWGNNQLHPHIQWCDQHLMPPPLQSQIPPCAPNGSAYPMEGIIINGPIPPPHFPPTFPIPPNVSIPQYSPLNANTVSQNCSQPVDPAQQLQNLQNAPSVPGENLELLKRRENIEPNDANGVIIDGCTFYQMPRENVPVSECHCKPKTNLAKEDKNVQASNTESDEIKSEIVDDGIDQNSTNDAEIIKSTPDVKNYIYPNEDWAIENFVNFEFADWDEITQLISNNAGEWEKPRSTVAGIEKFDKNPKIEVRNERFGALMKEKKTRKKKNAEKNHVSENNEFDVIKINKNSEEECIHHGIRGILNVTLKNRSNETLKIVRFCSCCIYRKSQMTSRQSWNFDIFKIVEKGANILQCTQFSSLDNNDLDEIRILVSHDNNERHSDNIILPKYNLQLLGFQKCTKNITCTTHNKPYIFEIRTFHIKHEKPDSKYICQECLKIGKHVKQYRKLDSSIYKSVAILQESHEKFYLGLDEIPRGLDQEKIAILNKAFQLDIETFVPFNFQEREKCNCGNCIENSEEDGNYSHESETCGVVKNNLIVRLSYLFSLLTRNLLCLTIIIFISVIFGNVLHNFFNLT